MFPREHTAAGIQTLCSSFPQLLSLTARHTMIGTMKRILVLVAAGVVVLAGIIVSRAVLLQSRQIDVAPAARETIDDAAAVRRFADALKIRTISYSIDVPPEAEAMREFHRYIEEHFPLVHQRLQRETVNDHSLLYTWRGRDPQRKPIIFMGHIDVVPVEPTTEGQWSHPPFEGRVAEGFIWGRGALDDKFGVMGILEAVEYLLAKGFQPEPTIYLAFGHDEELGGPRGAQETARLLASRGVQAEMVLDEGGSLVRGGIPGIEEPVACIGIAEKGYLSIELTARVTGGHSSSPPKHTAIGILSAAIEKLENNQMKPSLRGPVKEFIEHIGPEMPFGYRLLLANLWLLQPVLNSTFPSNPALNASIRTTTAVTIVQGGVKENVLPSSAVAIVNFRLLPGNTIADVVEHVRRETADPHIEVRPGRGTRGDRQFTHRCTCIRPVAAQHSGRLSRCGRGTLPDDRRYRFTLFRRGQPEYLSLHSHGRRHERSGPVARYR